MVNYLNWKEYIPFYVAFYRWGLYILLRILPSLFYRQMRYTNSSLITRESVTVVIPVYEPPDCFDKTIETITKNKPAEIIVVADITCVEKVREICRENKLVRVVPEKKPGKRSALATGIKNTKTKIVALVDDDIQWSDGFLKNLIAPFQHDDTIGGVGCKQVSRLRSRCDTWRILADMRLAVRFLELMATTVFDKGASCISGRTACYRADILQNDEFYDYLINEKFFGMRLQSGDDKCITRYIVNKGYKTYHQLRDSCKLSTTFEDGMRFFIQMFRWSRNTWRSDITALFIERYIWKSNPITAFILLDKMFTPFFMIYGITYLPYYAIKHEQYHMLLVWFLWVIFSRLLKLCYHFIDNPSHLIFLPMFVIFQYVQAFVKLWALCTMYKRNWGTRSILLVGNKTVRAGDVEDVEGVEGAGERRRNSLMDIDKIMNETEIDINCYFDEKKENFNENNKIYQIEKVEESKETFNEN